MGLWDLWTHALGSILNYSIVHFGSQAAGIIMLGLVIRLLLFPLSLASARKMHRTRIAMAQLKPDIEQLRERLKDDPLELSRQTMALYREKDISFFDKTSVINMLGQAGFGIGFLNTLRAGVFNSRFLWIADIGKPDIWLTFVVGILLCISMYLAPGSTAQHSMMMLVIPVLISTIFLFSLPSAVGLYWMTSNVVGVVQALLLRKLVNRSPRRKS